MIIITAKKDGFRRCGIAHSAKRVEYPADAFTSEQLAELQAEPMLVVERVATCPAPVLTKPLKEAVVVDPAVAEEEGPKDPLGEAVEAKPAPKPAGKKADKE